MDSKKLKRLASQILGQGIKKMVITEGSEERIKEAITKDDVRQLIKDGIIRKRKVNQHSRGRARISHAKRKKGRKRGKGRRYGTKKARVQTKKKWQLTVRAQRKKLREMRDKKMKMKISYRQAYNRVKGGFFKEKKQLDTLLVGDKK
jgi:large subunit ribosomal protein L19e